MKLVACLCALAVSGVALAQEKPAWPILQPAVNGDPLAGTTALEWEGDLAMRMVEGMHRFLDAEIASALATRRPGTREELAAKLGIVRDARVPGTRLVRSDVVARESNGNLLVQQVRWQAFGQVEGVGLLLERPGASPGLNVIVLPDADQAPEEVCRGDDPYALRLASAGCRVLVPVLINRTEVHGMPMREWLHRPAWELGRTLAGYEVQKVLAAVDCLEAESARAERAAPLVVAGWGEGGRLALYAAALDERIDGALVSGYAGLRGRVWDEPADRTVFGLLRGHADREVARLVAPRPLVIEHGPAPGYGFRLDADGRPERLNRGAGKRGKPGILHRPSWEEVRAEFAPLGESVVVREAEAVMESASWLPLMEKLGVANAAPVSPSAELDWDLAAGGLPEDFIARRQSRQVAQIDRHTQWALVDSQRVRAQLFAGLKTDNLEQYVASTVELRRMFSRDVIGEFASLQELPAPNPRSRPCQVGEKTVSYEVVLDVHEDVFAYGILTLPKDLRRDGSEKRPVVVCQHGLEGRPQDTVGEPGHQYYKAFATRLAERGFITFSPQNIYIGQDHFRILQFKANALGCTLFSLMVPQHRQITDWLAGLPFVDPQRIAFYGLSYGGKSAMRIPPLVDRYCLSICSADFNEWIWKNAATDAHSLRYSYANKGEYEIFEFDLGNTFNYYEMAALICPRPFMVERGHFDGVAPDETVAYEFARVRHLYSARLGIGDRTELEWFVGPHSINGVGTFAFLHRHLGWPVPE